MAALSLPAPEAVGPAHVWGPPPTRCGTGPPPGAAPAAGALDALLSGLDVHAEVARANGTRELCAHILPARVELLADGDGGLGTTSDVPVRTACGRAVAAWFWSHVLLADEADRGGEALR